MGRREPLILLGICLALMGISFYRCYDRFTYLLEVAPILIAGPIVIVAHRRFAFTPLVQRLLLVHASILILGAHYTYARVPLGFWMESAFGFARNHYDRIGHFAQGFVPALVAREYLLRRSPLRAGGLLFFLVTCVCLAFSALYELIEWWAAVGTAGGATEFLGTQGDPWDTQTDMLMCLVGAIVAQAALGWAQDRGVARLDKA